MQSLKRLAIDAAQASAHESQSFILGTVGFLSCTAWKQRAHASRHASHCHAEVGEARRSQESGKHDMACAHRLAIAWQGYRCLSTTSNSLSRQGGPQEVQSNHRTEQIYTLSNGISLARLFSAPGIAWLIASEQWQFSLAAVTLAGLSDLIDGYVAKTFNQQSVLGSYLDPLADKAVLCACFGALGWNGTLSPSLVTCVLSRDALLVLAHFYHRATVLKWQASSISEFFRTSTADGSPAAERVQPLLVGKISTFVQFGLVGACILTGAVGMPASNTYTNFLALNTYMWTVGSGVAYLLACPWIKASDKAVMLLSGTIAFVVYYSWLP